MWTALVWGLLLLAGATYATEEAQKNQQKNQEIPVWSPDWWPPSHLELIAWPPTHPEGISWPPQIPERNEAVLGTPAAIEEFPGLVQIENGFGPFWTQSCAGSVLTSHHVLSAARCFSGRMYSNRFRRIRAGSSTRNTGGVIVAVESVINHPSFKNALELGLDGDISIVRLSSPLSFSPIVQQVSVIGSGFVLPDNLPVVQTGWGSTAQGVLRANDDLYKVELISVDNDSCANIWRTLPLRRIEVTSNMICIGQPGSGGRNFGNRDLGAPILYDNIVIGVMSWGNILGNQRYPAVATAVSPYTNWIIENAV